MAIITYRDIVPLRGSINPNERAQLETLYNTTNQVLADLATEATELMHRRRDTIDTALAIRERLWPQRWHHGRRRPEPDANALPPMVPNPIWLHGRALRQICRDILRKNGPQTLTEIHATIHTYGYAINNTRPTKALADAMRYETQQGHATRIKRGVYAINTTGNTGPGEPRLHTEGGPPFTITTHDILKPERTHSEAAEAESGNCGSAERVRVDNAVRTDATDRYRPAAAERVHHNIVNAQVQHDVTRPLNKVARVRKRQPAHRRCIGNLRRVVVVEKQPRGRPGVFRETGAIEPLVGGLAVRAVHHADLGKSGINNCLPRQSRLKPCGFKLLGCRT
jgi:hypothetical protein